MAPWDSSDDASIPFTAVDSAPDTLTLPANQKLIVWSGKEFEPNGNVTLSGGGGGGAQDGTLELFANAIFTAGSGESHTIGGSLISGSNATFESDTSTVTFTTSGASRTINTNENPFYNVTFNGSGSWTVNDSVLTAENDFTISQGALTLPTGTTTIGGSFVNSGGSFSQNGGSMYFVAAGSETVRQNGSVFGTTTFAGTGSYSYVDTHATSTGDYRILSGTVTAPSGSLGVGGSFIATGTFAHNNGSINLTASGVTGITTGTSDLSTVNVVGAGSFTFTNTNVALLGSLRIAGGSVNLASGTMSIGGSFINTGGSFYHASGTILFNSTDTGEVINPGSSLFHGVSLASASGGWTINANATATANFSLVSASNFTQSSSTRLTVKGIFTNLVGGGATTWTGSTLEILSGSSYTINTKTAGGDVYNNIIIGSSTALRVWDSAGTVTMLDSASSLYSQDHAGVSGNLYIFGNYGRSTGADYWSYATDFDGTALGGSSRQVSVFMASSATTTYASGSTLNMVGGSATNTVVTNQGSGTFALTIIDSTLNALYYSLSNMNTDGLVLSGNTTVSSLSEGDYVLAVNGGTLVTLSSTTLNYNAGLVVTGASFATTSAITGVNVEVVGSTASAWIFTDHTGNFDGEAFDSDGGDDCGSVRWEDSVCLLTEQVSYRWRADDGGEGVPNSEWLDLDWTKRKRVTVSNADPTIYTNAVVEVAINYDGDMQVDFDDIRFTSSNGVTELNFVREDYTLSTDAVFWVEVPTVAADGDTAIYMYYGNGAATYAGVGTSTFVTYDDFEDDNIGEYAGDTALFDTDTTFAAQGTYGLEAANVNGRTTDGIYRTDVTVSQGETIRYFQYIDTGVGSTDEACTLFGVQSPGSNNDNYAVCLEQYGVDRVSIAKDVYDNDANGTVLATRTIAYSTGWYEIEVDWDTDDSIFVSVYRNDVLVATTSASDATYTSGGIGFTFWTQNGGWDFVTSRPFTETALATVIGEEQVPGGASWLAAINSSAFGIDVGTIIRPRFVIENTGLTISDAYRLQYAPKGASPSCEAVSSGSFVDVPVQASCSGSPICMESSAQFVNQDPTTDVLGGSGTFIPGEIIEDPSNTTASLGLDGGEYTEVEYAIEITASASDSNYCFRVSDAGVGIDSYSRVAELALEFEPDITSLYLNGGADIILFAGSTTTILATGTVSDLNGYDDIAYATTTIFRSGVGESCSADTNNCYIASGSSCTLNNCVGDSCDITCSTDIYYHADPTDIGTYAGETWRAMLSISDFGGAIATATAPSVDLITVRALSVDSSINYGTLEVNADTGSYNATTTLQNIGNDSIDVAIEGTNLTDGGSSAIPVSQQRFATSTFTYSACVFCSSLSSTSANYELDLTKPASTTPAIEDQLFWGIAIPYGISGASHQGTNIFYAIGD